MHKHLHEMLAGYVDGELSDEERQGLEELEQKYGIKIIVTDNPKLHQENYEISAL